MPFFIRGRGNTPNKKGSSKRPIKSKGQGTNLSQAKKQKTVNKINEEEITSSEDEEIFINRTFKDKPESQYKVVEEETPQEKKVRLAKQYLEEIRKQKEDEIEDEQDLDKVVNLKLKEDVLEAAGKLQRAIANQLFPPEDDLIHFIKCKQHKLSLTSIVLSSDEKFIFTASKDASIVKWNINGERLAVIKSAFQSKTTDSDGHQSAILSLALSTDGKYLASGDLNGILNIWNPETLTFLKKFKKHRGPISGLTFRKGTHTLYSASHDRLVMTWDLDEMAFMENLGGHQDCITSIDSLMRESCITSGGRDEMVIVYVIPEEKQLRFSASQGSIDGVKLVNEQTFISFGQDGSLALWSTLKKKPHFVVKAAHGVDPVNGEPNWLTAAATLINTDVIATGSLDGFVRVWKIVQNHRRLEPLFSVPVKGVVNALDFTSSGSHLVAAIGQEHKLGRWFSEKKAKNGLCIIPLNKKS